MFSVVEGDLICLAVEPAHVSLPEGWSRRLSGTAWQAVGPLGQCGYQGGRWRSSFCPLSALPQWTLGPLGTALSCSPGEPPNEIMFWAHAFTTTYTLHMQVCTCAQIRQAQTNKIQWEALHVGPYRHTHTHTHMSRCMNWSSLTYITLWPPSLSIILHPCRQPRLFAISAAADSYILLDRRRQKQWEES